ncbi:MAG: roadblock/LC7 domain-containing protein [Candidatus Odinarchaeia archaeon]
MSTVVLPPDKAEKLAYYLKEIASRTELEALAVVTKTGDRLAFRTINEEEIDSDLISALSAAMLHVGESAASKMGFKNLWEVIVTGEEGYLVLSEAGNVLIVGCGRLMDDLTKTVTVFRHFSKMIGELFTDQH